MKTAQEIFKESERVIEDDTSDAAMIRFIASIQLDALESVRKELENHRAVDIFYGYLSQEIAKLKAWQK